MNFKIYFTIMLGFISSVNSAFSGDRIKMLVGKQISIEATDVSSLYYKNENDFNSNVAPVVTDRLSKIQYVLFEEDQTGSTYSTNNFSTFSFYPSEPGIGRGQKILFYPFSKESNRSKSYLGNGINVDCKTSEIQNTLFEYQVVKICERYSKKFLTKHLIRKSETRFTFSRIDVLYSASVYEKIVDKENPSRDGIYITKVSNVAASEK